MKDSTILALQLFSDGEGAETGEPTAPDAGEQTQESFEALIRGRCKKDFERRVQSILSERLKANKANEERMRRFEPALTRLAKKYRLSGSGFADLDPEALEQALAGEQAEAEEKQHRQYERALADAQTARALYPGFELARELENPAFAGLLAADVDAQTAYEVVHKDEILLGGMRYAAQRAAERLTDAIRAGQQRPQENGAGALTAPTVQVNDPRELTRDQRRALRERVRRGEEIVW